MLQRHQDKKGSRLLWRLRFFPCPPHPPPLWALPRSVAPLGPSLLLTKSSWVIPYRSMSCVHVLLGRDPQAIRDRLWSYHHSQTELSKSRSTLHLTLDFTSSHISASAACASLIETAPGLLGLLFGSSLHVLTLQHTCFIVFHRVSTVSTRDGRQRRLWRFLVVAPASRPALAPTGSSSLPGEQQLTGEASAECQASQVPGREGATLNLAEFQLHCSCT